MAQIKPNHDTFFESTKPDLPLQDLSKGFLQDYFQVVKNNSIYLPLLVLIHEFAFSRLPPVLFAGPVVVEKSIRKQKCQELYFVKMTHLSVPWKGDVDKLKHGIVEERLTWGLWIPKKPKWVSKSL